MVGVPWREENMEASRLAVQRNKDPCNHLPPYRMHSRESVEKDVSLLDWIWVHLVWHSLPGGVWPVASSSKWAKPQAIAGSISLKVLICFWDTEISLAWIWGGSRDTGVKPYCRRASLWPCSERLQSCRCVHRSWIQGCRRLAGSNCRRESESWGENTCFSKNWDAFSGIKTINTLGINTH